MPVHVHLDQAALGRIAKSPDVLSATRRVAERVADHARSEGIRVGDTQADGVGVEIDLPVEVTDRHDGAGVILAHPAGTAVQAKHGTLTRAASAEGLKVTG